MQEWLPSIITISDEQTKGGEISNCHIILGESQIAVIDAGISETTYKAIKDALYIHDKKIGDITHIIMTHSHPDNIGALSALLNKSKAKLYAHEASKEVYKNPKSYVLTKQFPLDKAAKIGLSFKTPIFSGYRNIREPDFLLQDDQKISFDGNDILVRYIGGQSADSILLYDIKRRAAFIGDEGNIYTNHYDSFFIDGTGNALARKNFLKVWSNIKAKYFFPSHGYPIQGEDSFTYAQNLLIDHERIEQEVFNLLMQFGEAKEYLIGTEFSSILSFSWKTPYKELKVEHTTAKAILESLENEGKISYNEKTKRWKPIEE